MFPYVNILGLDNYPLDLIIKMVDLGADPNYDNAAPFIISCGYETIDVPLYFMKEHNIDVNIQNGMALKYCSEYDVFKMLLEHGFKLTVDIMKNYMRALKLDVKLIELFHQCGISMEELAELYTVLSYCINNEATNYLLTNINTFNANTQLLREFLIHGCNRNQLTIDQIKFLVEMGANTKDAINSAFICSCHCDNINIVMYLVCDCNANINASDSCALSYAIHHKQSHIENFYWMLVFL
jgi:hypothetical protein